MTLINGIGNYGYRPVTTFTSSAPATNAQTSAIMPQKSEEKKSNHTVIKLLGTAAVVAGAIFLLKNKSKVIDKLKELLGVIKPAETPVVKPEVTETAVAVENAATKNPLVERIESMVNLNKPAKSAEESMGVFVKNDVEKALSQKPVITAETIDAKAVANEAGKSAKESAAVFKEYGLTDTEKALKEAEKKAKPKPVRKPRTKTTGTKTKTKTTRKPKGKTPVRKPVTIQGQELPKINITKINEPRVINSQTIEEMVGLNRPVKSTQESMGVFVKRDIEQTLAQKPTINSAIIDAQTSANEAAKSAKESAKVFSEYGLTDTERALSTPPKKQSKKVKSGDYEPSKNRVIREHSGLGKGETVQPRSKANTRKIRHNKKQIIEQTLAKEQKYAYPEWVHKFETEIAAKKKAADVNKAWEQYEYRNLFD